MYEDIENQNFIFQSKFRNILCSKNLENTVLISIKIAAKTELRQNDKICGFCAFGSKYQNKISHDLNTVEWCYLSMMLEID